MISGIAMVAVGPLALLGALAAKNAQNRCDSELEGQYPSHVIPSSERYRLDDCNGYSTPFYALAIGGGLITAGGIALLIYGAKTVPARPASAKLEVLPWANPSSGGLRLRVNL